MVFRILISDRNKKEMKNQSNTKLSYMDTDSFIIHIKTEDFYKDIAVKMTHEIMKLIDHCQIEYIKKS